MPFTLPSRFALLPVGCALLSAALWGWSRGFPEPNWESSSAPEAFALIPEPAPVAVSASVSTPTPKPRSKPKPKPSPVQSAPKPAPEPVVAKTAVEPLPPAAPATPTPEPSPAIAQATPTPEPQPTPTPTPEPPRPSEAELAGPLPEHSPGEAAAPAATPANLEVADIARKPQLWPAQVYLVNSQRFPVVIKGVNVGNVQVPAGRPVTLRKVNPDGTLDIEFQGSPAKVKAQATDLVAQATARAASREKSGSTP